jgi:hypothetical protein
MSKAVPTVSPAQSAYSREAQKGIDCVTHPREGMHSVCQPYLTTPEAAAYLRRSVSWLLRRGDIAYLPGRPNTYCITDLDEWVSQHKHRPLS